MGLHERAERLAAGTSTLADEMGTASTSEAVGIALIAGKPDQLPAPWTGDQTAAWGRLDARQRAVVAQHAPAMAEEIQELIQEARRP